jgi:hypothetical protein
MAERARATITEALDRLEAARLAGSAPNADWHLWRSGLLSQRAMLEQLAMPDAAPETHDLAVAEARAAIASARREPPIHRALNAANASVVYQAPVAGGADPVLLDEAIRHIERAMRHRLDSEIRGRLQAQRASLLADREGSWDRTLASELRRAFESEQTSAYGSITRARGWANAAADAGLAAEAAEAYSRGLGVMSEVVSERLTRRFRGGPLRHGQGMAAEAAYWLVRERRFGEAAVALETGRAVSGPVRAWSGSGLVRAWFGSRRVRLGRDSPRPGFGSRGVRLGPGSARAAFSSGRLPSPRRWLSFPWLLFLLP